jgi:malonyl-CoA decarboxylase
MEMLQMKRPQILYDLLTRVSAVGRSLPSWSVRGNPSLGDLCAELLSRRGEATGLALAEEIFRRYEALDAAGRRDFFCELRSRFAMDEAAVEKAIAKWQETRDRDDARAIHFASEPKSQELIRRLNRTSNGTQKLIAIRENLLDELKTDLTLRWLDDDFRHLFSSWFNRGFLEIQRIDWTTSADILEKVIQYEAVHEINGWSDLRRRVAVPDRRLYAFFHPSLRNEPLIFVEVALLDGIPNAIQPILAEQRKPLDPRSVTTAVFYSISNCQAGLRGVSFGNFLIKQVVEELRREFETLETFVTLSPVPGLRRWASTCETLTEPQIDARDALEACKGASNLNASPEARDGLAMLAAQYLVNGKSQDGGVVDPVARFHLGNGARLEQVNVGADLSDRGIANSWGVMVNYLYDLKKIEANHEAFVNEGKVICAPAVRRLVAAS